MLHSIEFRRVEPQPRRGMTRHDMACDVTWQSVPHRVEPPQPRREHAVRALGGRDPFRQRAAVAARIGRRDLARHAM